MGTLGEASIGYGFGAETVDAEQRGMLRPLMDQAAKVPWDDRRALESSMSDLRESKVREYLSDIRSGLVDLPSLSDVCRRMQITRKVNDHDVPAQCRDCCSSRRTRGLGSVGRGSR